MFVLWEETINAGVRFLSARTSYVIRLDALGRMAPRNAHATLLSARRLLRKPGLKTLFEALRLYRTGRAGLLGCDPSHNCDLTHDGKWLF